MVVDDDPSALLAMRRLIEYWGFVPVPHSRFEEARNALTTDPPDALVVDVRLGLFNGLQLVLLAKQVRPDMTVIAVSGFDDSVLKAEATRAGAAYLVKPLDLPKLHGYLAAPDEPSNSTDTTMPIAAPMTSQAMSVDDGKRE
jgi:two-component system response regulator MprA